MHPVLIHRPFCAYLKRRREGSRTRVIRDEMRIKGGSGCERKAAGRREDLVDSEVDYSEELRGQRISMFLGYAWVCGRREGVGLAG